MNEGCKSSRIKDNGEVKAINKLIQNIKKSIKKNTKKIKINYINLFKFLINSYHLFYDKTINKAFQNKLFF